MNAKCTTQNYVHTLCVVGTSNMQVTMMLGTFAPLLAGTENCCKQAPYVMVGMPRPWLDTDRHCKEYPTVDPYRPEMYQWWT